MTPIAEEDEVDSDPHELDAFPKVFVLAGLGAQARLIELSSFHVYRRPP
jgi:hypothetical protein